MKPKKTDSRCFDCDNCIVNNEKLTAICREFNKELIYYDGFLRIDECCNKYGYED